MASKTNKEHWSQLLGILVIVGILIAVFYGYIVSLNSKHRVAECEAYASGKYSVTQDENLFEVMMNKCSENYN